VPDESAANDALTREIEELRDVLAHAKLDLARERDEQEATLGDLRRLKESLRELDASQRELFAKLGGES
jgi:chromosome segregation ATPase